jgi:very-short-patch-repair endonuclease/predicted transcriptional regulator of viral defense system
MRGELQVRRNFRAVAELAAGQHGVVGRRQLRGLAFGDDAIDRQLGSGRLHQVHRGVYAVGHRLLTQRGAWMAAVLAAGDAAVLSHRSAAGLWGLRPDSRSRVEVTVPASRHQQRAIQFHFAHLPPDEITTVDGIPTTTVPRTLFDLASVVAPNHVERAVNEAEVRRLSDALSLGDLLARYPRRRGSSVIRRILADGLIGVTRSELEELFVAFLDEHGLPRPKSNVWMQVGTRWIEVDCLWRDQRVIVELDGRHAHDTVAAFERDRARDRALAARGWRTLRVTWRQLHDEPAALAADLRAVLGAGF